MIIYLTPFLHPLTYISRVKQSGYFSRRVLVFRNQECGLTLVHTSEKSRCSHYLFYLLERTVLKGKEQHLSSSAVLQRLIQSQVSRRFKIWGCVERWSGSWKGQHQFDKLQRTLQCAGPHLHSIWCTIHITTLICRIDIFFFPFLNFFNISSSSTRRNSPIWTL